MEKIINNVRFNSNNYKNFNELILDLSKNNINYWELEGEELTDFWILMEDIRCYMLNNLKQFNMTWRDFKDYAKQWFDEYKEVDNSADNKFVLVWEDN